MDLRFGTLYVRSPLQGRLTGNSSKRISEVCRLENNIKMYIDKIWWEVMDWIEVADDGARSLLWRTR
jgi:hypothetical protein